MDNGKFTSANILAFITNHSGFTAAHLDCLLLLTITSLICM